MNVLVLNYEYPPIGGGGGAVTKELCSKIVENGNNVTVVTMSYKDLSCEEVDCGIKIVRVKCWRRKKRVCYPWEQLSYCINAYRYIENNIDLKNIDFVHCHFIIPTGIVALGLKKKYNLKYIITAHGSDVIGHNKNRFKLLYKVVKPIWQKILKNANVITAPSQFLIDEIQENYSGGNIRLIPNGINVSEYRIDTKKKNIITLSRLQKSKGIQDLIEACINLDLNGWIVEILGDGPYRKTLELMVKNNNLQNSVIFHGHIDGQKKFDFLSTAGAFFSGSKFESFSMSVLEASLCGCNIIAYRISPHIKLIGNEHVYNSKNQLRSMLEEVVKNEPITIDYHNDIYDWNNIYLLYIKIYEEVSNEK